jgi:hypothetical protein
MPCTSGTAAVVTASRQPRGVEADAVQRPALHVGQVTRRGMAGVIAALDEQGALPRRQ